MDGEDIPELARLYAGVVRRHGPERYSPAQVEAWASFAEDGPAFERFVRRCRTLLAEDETGILGFGGLEPGGRITALYVRSDRTRSGVGSALLSALLEEARARGMHELRAEASELSRDLLLRFGFRLEGEEQVERRGAGFTRYRMVLDLPSS